MNSLKKLLVLAVFALGFHSLYGQAAFNYRIYTINSTVSGLDPHDFSDCTTSTPFLFGHTAPNTPGPIYFGTGIKFQSGSIQLDLSVISTVGLSGAYADLTGKPTIPTVKRQESYIGTTNASGVYAVTYGTAFTNPNVQVNIIGGTRTDTWVTTSSITGFSIKCERRTDIAGLLPTFANINGLTVNVLVTEN